MELVVAASFIQQHAEEGVDRQLVTGEVSMQLFDQRAGQEIQRQWLLEVQWILTRLQHIIQCYHHTPQHGVAWP